jgi:hypothetical protein
MKFTDLPCRTLLELSDKRERGSNLGDVKPRVLWAKFGQLISPC